MQCKKCGNKRSELFYKGAKGWYCRECVRFMCTSEPKQEFGDIDGDYHLSFHLTKQQQMISEQLCKLVNQGNSVLLEAVCGAGKTELVCQTISSQLAQNKTVGFAIARRQVVLEIAQRLGKIFSHLKVTAVCQGYTKDIMGNIIVCTTHQLYRYYHYFDLLIIDEPDAFPYKGNRILHGIAGSACKGQKVYLTATPDNELMDDVKKGKLSYLYLPKRPGGNSLIVPHCEYAIESILKIKLCIWVARLIKKRKPLLLFVPSKKMANRMHSIARFFIRCCVITSATDNRDREISDFKKGKYNMAICTSVLERGITIPHVNVIVMRADHSVFDQASLIQISGRVGRSVKDPNGDCIFLSAARTKVINEAINRIVKANNE